MSKKKVVNNTSENKKRRIPLLWIRIIMILVVALVIGCIASLVTFYKNREAAKMTVTLQMSFDGAADAIAPNGYRFDIRELFSDDVLNGALKASELDSTFKAEDIRRCITVVGKYPSDIVAQTVSYDSLLDFAANREITVDRFHPTQFTITLNNTASNNMTKAQMNTLLRNIVAEYRKYFATVSVMGRPAEDDTIALGQYDYTQQLEIIGQQLTSLADYAAELNAKDPSFRYEGVGFADIVVRMKNLISNDISRINAKLTLNALTKAPERLLSQYRYELRNLNDQLNAQKKALVQLDNMIASYEKAEIIYISTSDDLTRIDGKSSETYDGLVEIRKKLADDNTKLISRREDTLLKLQDLLGGVDLSKIAGTQDGEDTTGDPGTTDTADDTDNTGNTGDTDTADGGDGQGDDDDPMNWSDEKIVAALHKAAQESSGQREALESEIAALVKRCKEVQKDFATLLQARNDEKINDMTMEVGSYRYVRNGLTSGEFMKTAVMETGPFVALALIISMIMIIVSNAKSDKRGSATADENR